VPPTRSRDGTVLLKWGHPYRAVPTATSWVAALVHRGAVRPRVAQRVAVLTGRRTLSLAHREMGREKEKEMVRGNKQEQNNTSSNQIICQRDLPAALTSTIRRPAVVASRIASPLVAVER